MADTGVVAIDGVPERLRMAAAGQAETIDNREVKVYDRLMELTKGRGPDRCIDAVGCEAHGMGSLDGVVDRVKTTVGLATDRGHVLREAILCCRKGGTLSIPGAYVGTVDQLPLANLACPLCVIDIAARAQDNPDAQVTPADITAWEGAHGPIPAGAWVAMHSGWDAHVASDKFRNADAAGVMHFPGFHPEAAALLLEGRQAVGIGVDTLSLDYGASKDFAVHYAWLPSNRWGIECLAGLGALPASGATLIVGAPKVKGATGGPARILALV